MRLLFEVVVFIVFFFGLTWVIEEYQCMGYGKKLGVTTDYSAGQCYVKQGDNWVTTKMYDIANLRSE